MAAVQVRNDLAMKWEELKIPPAERIETLTALLDTAQVTPELLALYETINTKLTARQPISQVNCCMQSCGLFIIAPNVSC